MDSWGENHCLGQPVIGPCTLATPSFPACACQSCLSAHPVFGRCPLLHADPGSDGSPAPLTKPPTSSHLWMRSCPLTSTCHSVAFYSFILLSKGTLKLPCFLLFTYFSGFPVLQLSAQEQERSLSCSRLFLQHLQQ